MRFRTERSDWYFIGPATIIWLSGLAVIFLDFIVIQQGIYQLSIINCIGVAMVVCGTIIRIVARSTLGKQFTHGLKTIENHSLVTSGIYRYIRHPSYTGLLLIHPGTGLLFGSTFGFLIMLLFFPTILYRIRVEEKMLLEEFGEDYLEYTKRTKKLIPFLY